MKNLNNLKNPRGTSTTDNASPSRKLVVIFATLDSSAPIGYFLLGGPLILQIIAISIKMLLVLFNLNKLRLRKTDVMFLTTILVLTLTSSMVEINSIAFPTQSLLRYISFVLSISLTLSLIRKENFYQYIKFVMLIPLIAATTHIFLFYIGALESHFGRYYYLGGSHPNLGGEISAISTLAASLTLKLPIFLIVAAIFAYSTILMQSRSAIIVISSLILIRVLFFLLQKENKLLGILIGILLSLSLAYLMFGGFIDYVLQNILLTNDKYRGFGTGFVGRDIRWLSAFDLFLNSPIFGNGIGIFDNRNLLSPHNAFLYSLALHGVLSFAFWSILANRWKEILSDSPQSALLIAAFIVVLVFNDRFINLNLYPFLLYVVILSIPLEDRISCPR